MSDLPIRHPLLHTTRRTLLAGAGLMSLGALLPQFSSSALAQRRDGPDEVAMEELMKPGPLPSCRSAPPKPRWSLSNTHR